MVSCDCSYCGQLMLKRKADRARGWGRFCDKSCKALFAARGPKKAPKTPAPLPMPSTNVPLQKAPKPVKPVTPKPEGYGGWA